MLNLEPIYSIFAATLSNAADFTQSDLLVIIFTLFIAGVYFRNLFKMRRMTSVGLEMLRKLHALIRTAAGTGKIASLQELVLAQKCFVSTMKDREFLRRVEREDLIAEWKKIELNLTYEVGGDTIYSSMGFMDSFFNFDHFMNSIVARSVLLAPSVLTGLGIIGTFLGLALGVGSAASGLASPDITVAREAMSNLLSGAQLAFISSLAGLFFALLLRLSFAKRSEKIRLALEDLKYFFSSIAIPRDAGISGLGHLVKIAKNTAKFPDHNSSLNGLNTSVVTLVTELQKFSEPANVRG